MNPTLLRKQACDLRAKAQAVVDKIQAEEHDAEALTKASEEARGYITEAKALDDQAHQIEDLQRDVNGGTLAARNNPAVPTAPSPELPTSGGTLTIPAEPKDTELEARGGFQDIGDFCLSVWSHNPAAGNRHFIDPRLNNLYDPQVGAGRVDPAQQARSAAAAGVRPMAAASGLSQSVGADGGWLLPTAFRTEIWDGMRNEVDSLLQFTDQFPIEGAESIELLANAETSRATGSRYGGIQGYWIAEADQITGSKPKVRRVIARPQELAVLCYVTDRLLNNAGSVVAEWIRRAASSELNWLIGDAIINGNGAGKPFGILNSGGLVAVAKEGGQAADTFTQRNIAKMWSRMHARSRRNAQWLINQDVDPELLSMFFPVTTVATTENVGGFATTLYNADKDTIMGRPIIRTEWNKTIGDQGDVLLADLKAYVTAFFRTGVQSAMSMHLRFDYLETAFRFVTSVDGQTWNNAPLTPANGTSTLSPFVVLADRT